MLDPREYLSHRTRPVVGMANDSDSEDELPPGWREQANKDGSVAFINSTTGSFFEILLRVPFFSDSADFGEGFSFPSQFPQRFLSL